MEALPPLLRLVIFGGEFLALAAVAAWFIIARSTRTALSYQIMAGIGALLTLPAVIVSVVSLGAASVGPLLTGVSILALVGFLITGAALTLALTTGEPASSGVSSAGAAPYLANEPIPAAAMPMERTNVALNVPAAEPIGAPPVEASGPTMVGGPESPIVEPAGPTMVGDGTISVEDANRTVVGGTIGRPVGRLAYLIERSGDGRAHRLLNEEVVIGRGQTAQIVLSDSQVSREHLKIKLENQQFVAYDLGGTNGSFVVRDGERRRIQEPVILNDGDVLFLGPATQLVYLDVAEMAG